MKFLVTMKDPDALGDAIQEAVRLELYQTTGIDPEDRDLLQESREQRAHNGAAKWFKYGEYLTIEIDTNAGTATVCSPT